MNIQRVLAVVAAVMIVCAVGLATLEVHPAALGQLLSRIDGGLLDGLQNFVRRWGGAWAWNSVVAPLLQRPAWLPPVGVALVAIGLAVSLAGRKSTQRSRRRS